MPTCERCWSRAFTFYKSQVEQYERLVTECNCTPEEQAGLDARECPLCHRYTVHQYAHTCVVCGIQVIP